MIRFLLPLLITFSLFAQDSTYQKITRMKDSISLSNITEHIKKLEYAGGYYSRVTFNPGNDTAALYIKSEFEKIPGLIVEADTFFIQDAVTPFNTKPVYNIIATIPGKKNPEKQFIIGAHYDCSASRMGSAIWNQQWRTIKAPGADDNATGVAGILEMARVLSDTSISFYNDYTIKLIAFAAEEYSPGFSGHHLGSIHHAQNAALAGDQIIGMISMDMVGFNSSYYYTAIVSDANSSFIGTKVNESRTLFDIPILTNNAPFPSATYSDHLSYNDEGFSAILLIENAPPWNNGPYYTANPYYHTSYDTIGTVNLELTKRVTQLTLVTAASFASELTDAVEELTAPDVFYLAQNYPNPFNPSTTIRFNLPESGEVQLKIYDLLGNEIAVLADNYFTAGTHKFQFNASGLSSGIYIYQLRTNGFSESKKMIFLK